MGLSDELWQIVRTCFEEDDGSLPSVEIIGLAKDEVATIYHEIRCGSRISTESPAFWDKVNKSERLLDDVPNAALLVATGKADPFYFGIVGLAELGTPIPSLGVFIFQSTIALDYRAGSDWGPEQVFAWFSWLRRILAATKRGSLVPSESEGPRDPEAFLAAWRMFCSWSERDSR